ncbi:MAG: DUF86 domain-containing protein [Armatimonadota bacterium]|nr:DUF86 domain-containing protein [Armatimonadota bacterium]
MSQDYRLYLTDIRRACEKVRSYTAGLTFDQFVSDSKTRDAVLHNLAIIGEAVKKLPQEICERAPVIEWRKIARFRDIVIHHYFAVDNQIVWDIVVNKVPELVVGLEHLADDAEPNNGP